MLRSVSASGPMAWIASIGTMIRFRTPISDRSDETTRLQQQLSQILGHMQLIDQLDTSAIPPTAQVIPVSSIMREDLPRPSTPVDEILQNAPRREGDFFEVPPVLE